MKKILFCGAILCFAASFANAQGLSLQINQLSSNRFSVTPNIPDMTADADLKASVFSVNLVGSFAAFHSKPDNLLRVSLGYSSISLDGKSNASYGNDEYDKNTASASQRNIHIAPGISKNLAGSDRYSLYTGIDLPFAMIGSTNFEAEGESQTHDFNDSLIKTTYRNEGHISGGFSLGLSPFLGFSYNGKGPFSIGTEIATGFQYSMFGPDAEVKYYEDGVFQETQTSDLTLSSFSKMPMRVSLVLGYRFGGSGAE